MNYLEMSDKEKFMMQKLMLRRYSQQALEDGFTDEDCRDMMVYELKVFEEAEKFEECALLRDTIKRWDDLND